MKIVMVDSLVGNDYTLWLCRGLAKAGYDVTLICPENRQEQGENFKILPVSPVKGSGNSFLKIFKYLYFLLWLFAYLQRSQADIIHYQFFRRERAECLYFPLLRLLNKPLYFTAHNIVPHEAGRIDYALRSLVYQSASRIIVHSPNVKSRLLEKYGKKVAAEKVHVVPAVKPVSGTRDASITREIARERLGIAPEAKILLFFGYIREYKGLDLLLKAFDIAREKDESLKLYIAGKPQTDELFTQYQQQIASMRHGESVIFRPEFIPKEDVDYYFRAADALALPYNRIDFSGVVQEAFAYGLPVLATNVGNFRDIIQDGVNGYTTDKNTVVEFAEIIRLAFQDAALLGEMGKAAYAFDQNYPSWEKIGLITGELYEQERQSLQLAPAD